MPPRGGRFTAEPYRMDLKDSRTPTRGGRPTGGMPRDYASDLMVQSLAKGEILGQAGQNPLDTQSWGRMNTLLGKMSYDETQLSKDDKVFLKTALTQIEGAYKALEQSNEKFTLNVSAIIDDFVKELKSDRLGFQAKLKLFEQGQGLLLGEHVAGGSAETGLLAQLKEINTSKMRPGGIGAAADIMQQAGKGKTSSGVPYVGDFNFPPSLVNINPMTLMLEQHEVNKELLRHLKTGEAKPSERYSSWMQEKKEGGGGGLFGGLFGGGGEGGGGGLFGGGGGIGGMAVGTLGITAIRYALPFLKGMGKIALPLFVLFTAIDAYESFSEGFDSKKAEELFGKDGWFEKLGTSLSLFISRLTGGLIKPKEAATVIGYIMKGMGLLDEAKPAEDPLSMRSGHSVRGEEGKNEDPLSMRSGHSVRGEEGKNEDLFASHHFADSPEPVQAQPPTSAPAQAQPSHARGGSGTAADYKAYADLMAVKYGLDGARFKKQLYVESHWNPYAVSEKGAKGIGQFTDATAEAVGLADPFDPYQNIEASAKYMAKLLQMFGGDYEKALAAYHSGAGKESSSHRAKIEAKDWREWPKTAAYVHAIGSTKEAEASEVATTFASHQTSHLNQAIKDSPAGQVVVVTNGGGGSPGAPDTGGGAAGGEGHFVFANSDDFARLAMGIHLLAHP